MTTPNFMNDTFSPEENEQRVDHYYNDNKRLADEIKEIQQNINNKKKELEILQ